MARRSWSLLLLAAALAVPARAADEPAAGQGGGPMAGWAPRKVTADAADKKQIAALFKAMEDAGKKGDLDAAAALVDFPVLMVTDDSKGEATAEPWSRERWMAVMAPFYKSPAAEMMKVTHKPSVFLVSDSLASVDDQQTMTIGGKKITTRTSSLLVRKGGRWLVKSMVEGGWGDAMKAGGGAGPQDGAGAQAGGGAGAAPAPGQGSK